MTSIENKIDQLTEMVKQMRKDLVTDNDSLRNVLINESKKTRLVINTIAVIFCAIAVCVWVWR